MDCITKIYYEIASLLFVINGKKPWGIGYDGYKKKKITYILKSGDFNTNELPKGYGSRVDERIVEYPWLLSRLPSKKGILLDAGSVLNYDFILQQNNIRTKKIFISTLAPESRCFWRKGISYVYEDLRETCYKDNYFDWIVCLSTIEHIGLDNTMLYTSDNSKQENNQGSYLLVIRNLYRILKPGGILYVSLPFGQKKNHGWLQVFDSEMVDNFIREFSPTSIIEHHFKYESGGWQVSSRKKDENAIYFDIHNQKSYDIDYAAAARAIVCLELEK